MRCYVVAITSMSYILWPPSHFFRIHHFSCAPKKSDFIKSTVGTKARTAGPSSFLYAVWHYIISYFVNPKMAKTILYFIQKEKEPKKNLLLPTFICLQNVMHDSRILMRWITFTFVRCTSMYMFTIFFLVLEALDQSYIIMDWHTHLPLVCETSKTQMSHCHIIICE